MPHLPCKIQLLGDDEPVPPYHLCSQIIPSANCVCLQTVVTISYLWEERGKEGGLDKKSTRLQDSSKKGKTSPVSNPWMKGGNIEIWKTSSSTWKYGKLVLLGEEELTTHIYKIIYFVVALNS